MVELYPMPYIRRYRLRKPLYRRRRAVASRRYPNRPVTARMRALPSLNTFTESYHLTTINAGTGGVTAGLLSVAMNEIPQYTQYQNLYNQYCIKSVQFLLMPSYDAYDSANLPSVTTPSITAPRLVYAINNSATQGTPASELDVIKDNGCKIRQLDRPVRIRCRPVAQVALTDSNTNLTYESKKYRWLPTGNMGTAHTGVAYAITQTIASGTSTPVCEVYAKVTFSLRDPK